MAKYFLIESRSSFDSAQVSQNYQLASDLANAGNETTLFLVENGVLAARAATHSSPWPLWLISDLLLCL